MAIPTAENLSLLAEKDTDDLQRHEAIGLVKYLLEWRDSNLEVFQLGLAARARSDDER